MRPSSNAASHEVKLETGAIYTIVLGEENEEVNIILLYINLYTVNGSGNLMMLEIFCILLAKMLLPTMNCVNHTHHTHAHTRSPTVFRKYSRVACSQLSESVPASSNVHPHHCR